jgi:prepilin-type N-terminal cleavage/methylation domain-containing protein
MISLKRRQTGFTIVELLIVIVVIGILAALVLNSFQGVQARARDTERRTDVNAVATQLEVYYNDKNGYPTGTDVSNTTWQTANLKGADAAAFVDPKGRAINATSSSYTFANTGSTTGCVSPTDNTGADTATGTFCEKFVLTADLEKSADVTKNSLN